ncbi:MAG: SDR family oxidoreductase [Paracoccaceae bacterium]
MRAASGGFVDRDIRVNAICPRIVTVASNDAMTKIQKSGQEVINTNNTHHPYKIAKPKEIAEGIMFLISDGSSFMTGTELVIDGGFLRNQ